MRKWKTYIVDDYTPFHGMNKLDSNKTFHKTLSSNHIALIITDGKGIDIWDTHARKDVLIDSTKKLDSTNLKKDYKNTFEFDAAIDIYYYEFNIDISEPKIYNARKITI